MTELWPKVLVLFVQAFHVGSVLTEELLKVG